MEGEHNTYIKPYNYLKAYIKIIITKWYPKYFLTYVLTNSSMVYSIHILNISTLFRHKIVL